MVMFICPGFGPEIHFLDKFGPKNQNCLFEMKLGTYTNSNMLNSTVFKFPFWTGNILFWANLIQTSKIV